MIKTWFMTGTRVAEFVHIQVKEVHLDADPPQIYINHAKGTQSARCPSCRAWPRNCALIYKAVARAICLRATGRLAFRYEACSALSKSMHGQPELPNASTHICFGIRWPRYCSSRDMSPLIKFKSFSALCSCPPLRFMPRPLNGPSANTPFTHP